MLEIKWFNRQLDYQGFVDQCRALFGEKQVLVFEYHGDVVQQSIEMLGLATPHDNPTPRQNQSLNSVSIAILRTLNQHNINAKDKERLMTHIKPINDIVTNQSKPLINSQSKARVLALAKPVQF